LHGYYCNHGIDHTPAEKTAVWHTGDIGYRLTNSGFVSLIIDRKTG